MHAFLPSILSLALLAPLPEAPRAGPGIGPTDVGPPTRLDRNQPEFLRWRFERGERFEVMRRQSSPHDFPPLGIAAEGWNEETVYFSWLVESVEKGGTARIKVTIDRITLEGKPTANGAAASFDSDRKAVPGEKEFERKLAAVRALAGVTFTMNMNTYGQIIGFTSLERAPAARSSQQLLPGLQLSLPELTSGTVEPGATWKSSGLVRDVADHEIKVALVHTFHGAPAGQAPRLVNFSGELSLGEEAPAVTTHRLLEPRFQGTLDIDNSRRYIPRSRLDYSYTLESTTAGKTTAQRVERTAETTVKPLGKKPDRGE